MKFAVLTVALSFFWFLCPALAGPSDAPADSNMPAIELNKMNEMDYFPRKIVTGPKAWAVACCALLIECNHEWHDTLATGPCDSLSIQRSKDGLKEWSIENKADLLKELNWLEVSGHRESFEKLGRQIYNGSFLDFFEMCQATDDKEELNEFHMAYQYYDVLGKKSLIGWDFERAIYLCRTGYECGYISENEAWYHIMKYAQYLQQTFDSWEDLGRNYIIGRKFWAYQHTLDSGQDFNDAFMLFTEMPSSPWNTLDWNMNLKESEATYDK